MLRLQQQDLDDIEAALEVWLDSHISDHAMVIRQRLREAVDRIYEVCQTAHARELRKSSAASTNSLDNDSALT